MSMSRVDAPSMEAAVQVQQDGFIYFSYIIIKLSEKCCKASVCVCVCVCLEAERAVTNYTESISELLHRKKIRREVLFRYAHQENIATVKPTDEKVTLIRKILCHLGYEPLPVDFVVSLLFILV